MDEHAHKRLVLENSLRKALEKEEFRLYYQPKVDIVTGSVTAMEALLRWQHPEFGLVAPGDFIPLAEETGLILPIGEWVLEKACLQNLTWQGQGLPKMRVAVNLSGHQLQQKNFLDIVKRVLVKTGLPAQYLELEITETVIMQNPEFVIEILKELQQLGAHISVDDFGTGYSSLAHLKRFSINTLKIDKSFVRDVTSNSTDAAIATAIIAMGNSLKLKVIAEGVETEGQFSFLQRSMCDEVQGYLVSRPMPADKVFDFIRGRSWEKIGRGGERSE
jgi:EAL domain-containing protein (putative c-di-GMP-specific phosphodiesterase class I)